jgi:hypothetical protein
MLYAILAYHVEAEVMSWTPEEDAALMADLLRVHHRLIDEGLLGPAARLGPTNKGRTLRGPGSGLVVDGPFAETKEQLLGFYTIDCATEEAPSRLRATCAAPIQMRFTKSVRCPFICREWPSRSPRPKRTAISGDDRAVVEAG